MLLHDEVSLSREGQWSGLLAIQNEQLELLYPVLGQHRAAEQVRANRAADYPITLE